jgi:mRNA degradation ribonuclease J1/J2
VEPDKEAQLRERSAKLLNDFNTLVLLCDYHEMSTADYHNPPESKPAQQLERYIVSFKQRIAFLEQEVERLHERAVSA